ncbi:efflux RND transporter periplasmic adaptor subunit [Bacteroidota bacterium]
MGKGKKKKSKKKFIIFGGLALLLIIVVTLVLTGGDKERIFSVQTEKVEKRTVTQVVTATGRIHPKNQVVLRPEVNGEIVALPIEEGDKVRKGQLLIRIKPEQYRAQRNQARAQLESAKAQLKVRNASLDRVKADYKRKQGLNEKGLASEQELEIAKSNFLQGEGQYEAQNASVMQAQENLNNAEEQLRKTTIYSPMDGRITALRVEINERVLGSSFSVGTHLMTVADLSNMEARVEVDENDVILVSIGDTAKVEVDAFSDKTFTGIVSQIGNSAQTAGAGTQDEVVNFEVRVGIIDDEEQLRPGMSCDADIETETRVDVITVPIQCVTARIEKIGENGEGNDEGENSVRTVSQNNGNKNGKNNKPKEVVFIVDNNVAKKIEVETGISDDTYIEINAGLEGDEEIISGPYRAISKDLEDGAKVRLPVGSKKSETKTDDEEKQDEQKEEVVDDSSQAT